jgi:hypothetical protein
LVDTVEWVKSVVEIGRMDLRGRMHPDSQNCASPAVIDCKIFKRIVGAQAGVATSIPVRSNNTVWYGHDA